MERVWCGLENILDVSLDDFFHIVQESCGSFVIMEKGVPCTRIVTVTGADGADVKVGASHNRKRNSLQRHEVDDFNVAPYFTSAASGVADVFSSPVTRRVSRVSCSITGSSTREDEVDEASIANFHTASLYANG